MVAKQVAVKELEQILPPWMIEAARQISEYGKHSWGEKQTQYKIALEYFYRAFCETYTEYQLLKVYKKLKPLQGRANAG